ncbi:glycosyltransferase [Anaerolentibacter hominis]|uniref:glycosyltransferase n=1 Tax=Anaerolentibacter hominis TaxID=3079009 RepID=UPI0031B85F69
MRVLLVMDQFDNDNNGTTITARRLASALRRHGHEVYVIGAGKKEDHKFVVKTYPLPPIVKQLVTSQGMVFARPNRRTLREAICQVDVVHFLMPFRLSIKGLKIAEELGVPRTAAFHVQPENITYSICLGTSEPVNRRIYQFFYKHFYYAFTHIHCPSRFIADQLVENGYGAKLHVISNGVDPDFVYRKIPKKAEWMDRFVILMIGRFSNEKRQDLLIEGIKKSRYESSIQLVMAGQGPKKEDLRKLGRVLTHEPVMEFYSHEDLMDVIAMSDLYVHASDAEIEAISCMEAFSSGLVPIIANSVKSATPQFALDERSLFEAGSSSSLAEKIDYWMEHERERKEMEQAYSEHGKQYSLDACVDRMEEMFREEIEERTGVKPDGNDGIKG